MKTGKTEQMKKKNEEEHFEESLLCFMKKVLVLFSFPYIKVFWNVSIKSQEKNEQKKPAFL